MPDLDANPNRHVHTVSAWRTHPMPDLEEDCITAGNPNRHVPTIPLAWDVPKDELGQKRLYILRLIGLHLQQFSDVDQNRIIRLLMRILEIKPLKYPDGKRSGFGAFAHLEKGRDMDEEEKESLLMLLSEELQDLLDRYRLDHGLERDDIATNVENFVINWENNK